MRFRIFLAVCCCIPVMASLAPVAQAADVDVEVDESDTVIINRTDYGDVSASVDEIHSSENSSEGTQGGSSASLNEHSEAYFKYGEARDSARDILNSIIGDTSLWQDIASGNNNGLLDIDPNAKYAYGVDNTDLDSVLSIGTIKVPASTMQELYGYVLDASSCLTEQDAINRNGNAGVPSTMLHANTSVRGMDGQTKQDAKEEIAKENGLLDFGASIYDPSDLVDPGQGPGGDFGTVGFRDGALSILVNPGAIPPIGISMEPGNLGQGFHNAVLNQYRTDIIQGGILDCPLWTVRMEVLSRFVQSNAMNDYCTLVFIEDYHITDYTRDDVAVTDRTSSLRHWSVTDLSTGEIVSEIDTNDPVYYFQGFKEGLYQVQEYAKVRTTASSLVSYDYSWYLVDAQTKRVLYFEENLVSDGKGGSVKISSEETISMEPTGQTLTIRVNALGEASTVGTGIERVK